MIPYIDNASPHALGLLYLDFVTIQTLKNPY